MGYSYSRFNDNDEGMMPLHLSSAVNGDSEGQGRPVNDVDWGDEFDENAPLAMGARLVGRSSLKSRVKKSRGWSEEEDKVLRTKYAELKGDSTIFKRLSKALRYARQRSRASGSTIPSLFV